ncbi:hypothetical protein C0Q70_17968 [Pomacea canaliculata]|uniref:Uncharacterized protein n=1 Tax=Pomacea canaliculata TaxID=400727 RepID=A0A2T7NLW6_POMCA|nr:hypothetical protein C0Q70_17968 [Pomacea canaliculata]
MKGHRLFDIISKKEDTSQRMKTSRNTEAIKRRLPAFAAVLGGARPELLVVEENSWELSVTRSVSHDLPRARLDIHGGCEW